jgi:tRNA(Ile)-lysidine synthase
VSGGADSTALIHLVHAVCRHSGTPVVAAHFNHNLRAEVSGEADRRSVAETCERLGLALLVGIAAPGEISALSNRQRSGLESAARDLRYRFLADACAATASTLVCTGHTQDDQVETIVMGLEKGVHPMSLTGIPAQRRLGDTASVCRPLLDIPRTALARMLIENGLSWSEDPSNHDTTLSRNRVRRDLARLGGGLPGLIDSVLAVRNAALRRRRSAERASALLKWAVSGDESRISKEDFFSAPDDARLVCVFAEMGRRKLFRSSSRISVSFFAPLLGGTGGKCPQIRSRGQHIRVEGAHLVWSSDVVRGGESGYLRVVTPDTPVRLPQGTCITLLGGEKPGPAGEASVLQLGGVRGPLIVRSPRTGDRISVGSVTKSVLAILSDRHVPVSARCTIPVLCDRDGVAAVLVGVVVGQGHVVSGRLSTRGDVRVVISESGDMNDA